MRSCDYCGKENDESSGFCVGCGCSLDEPRRSLSFPWTPFLSWGGLVVTILGIGIVVLSTFPFFYYHNDIGPGVMLSMIYVLWIAVISFAIGIPCAILAIKKGRRRIGWLSIFLALAPVPLGWAMLKFAMVLNGFHFD